MKCAKCGGESFRKKGKYMNSTGTFQIWQCKDCAKNVVGHKLKEAINYDRRGEE